MRHTEAISPALVVADDHAPAILTEVGARRLIGEIRDCLALSDDKLIRAYTGRAWEALGYDTFEAMCAAEIPQFRMLKLKTAARRERVAALRKEGATIPEMVAATNSSLGSVHRDLQALEGGHTRETKAQPEPLPEPTGKVWEQAYTYLLRQADRGLTRIELAAEAGWSEGKAGGALADVLRRGKAERADVTRLHQRVFLAVPEEES